jgi:23S rRNA pseudouridine2605 synthase/16S rRNA pseudouridine516 synthase
MTTPKSSKSTEPPRDGERLQKLLSRAGVASRRHAEQLITSGRVCVDGVVVTELGTRIDPATASVMVDGEVVHWDEPRRYVLLNKPTGYVTTVSDTHGRPTVLDLVPNERPGLFPVGRLDLESEGLLLLTDDGELANLLTHPRYHVPKTYEVTLEGTPSPDEVRRLEEGIELEDGLTAQAEVGAVRRTNGDAILTLTLREGRKRQVRRMCAAIGHPVKRLVRMRIGPVGVGDLDSGDSRELTEDEVELLRQGARG